MTFGQLIKYNKINIFFITRADNEAGRVFPDLLLFLKITLYEVKASVCSLVLKYFDSPQHDIQLKQTLRC